MGAGKYSHTPGFDTAISPLLVACGSLQLAWRHSMALWSSPAVDELEVRLSQT